MLMRVLIDSQIFNLQRRGGISRYFASLASQMEATPGIDLRTGVAITRNEPLLLAGVGARRVRLVGARGEPRWLGLVNRAYTRFLPEPDVRHYTYYDPRYLARRPNAKTVVTVHDMIPESHGGEFGGSNAHLAKRQYVDACHAVICVSEATRQELFRWYGAPDKPVVVTHEGVDDYYFQAARQGARDYVLFVGNRSSYKNFSTLLKAYALLRRDFPHVALRCIGGGALTPEERSDIAGLELTGHVFQETVIESELPSVYASAAAFCFPSVAEGFGLPALESLATGTPTVLSDIPPFREVADDAAAYFDPTSVEQLVERLTEALGRGEQDDSAREYRRRRARVFSWEKTAAATIALYESLL